MQTSLIEKAEVRNARAPLSTTYLDPLDWDMPDDQVVLTTRRGLTRLALVAAETGARFDRESVLHDPVAWMLTPRRLFGGRTALDACLGRDECLRAVLLHGLSIGLDADPDEIDQLVGDECHDDLDDGDFGDRSDPPGGEEGGLPRLWTSLVVGESDEGTVQAFDAVVAGSRIEAEARLRARHGAAVGSTIEVVEGFDPRLPLVDALVSATVADMLEQVAHDPGSPLARGLSVSVEQRFAA